MAPGVEQLIAELSECDWVLVEGFKNAALPKIEVWRAQTGKPVRYPDDPYVIAVATDDANLLPAATRLPVLDLNDADAVAEFILASAVRCEYAELPGT
jgi:molybdopterin-guanine dinucleotide biosynthesis protein B